MSDSISGLPSGLPQIQRPDAKITDPAKARDMATLQKAAKEFESVFMNIVMKSMRDSVEESDAFGETEKVKFFQSMLDEEYSKMTASTGKGGLGIADSIVKQLGAKILNTQLTEQTKK